jgi:hypothetical protein
LQALAAADAARRAAETQAAEDAAQRIRIQAEKAAQVPEEVAAGSPDPYATCMFRLPDGSRLLRRCRLEESVQVLFDFVDSKGGGGMWPNSYQLVLQFPRRALPASGATLKEAGFEERQQYALFLEPLTLNQGGEMLE